MNPVVNVAATIGNMAALTHEFLDQTLGLGQKTRLCDRTAPPRSVKVPIPMMNLACELRGRLTPGAIPTRHKWGMVEQGRLASVDCSYVGMPDVIAS